MAAKVHPWVKTLPKLNDGEEIKVPAHGKKATIMHECCECGAEHKVELKYTGANFILRFWRRK